jgi:hypothetical protein
VRSCGHTHAEGQRIEWSYLLAVYPRLVIDEDLVRRLQEPTDKLYGNVGAWGKDLLIVNSFDVKLYAI